MAGKRSATSDLNHDNWNQEDEPEERGSFKKASDDALKNRVIKTAKRRNPIRNEESSAFAGFSGFGNKPASGDFSFLKNLSSSNSAPKTNGIDKSQATAPSLSANFLNTTSPQSIKSFNSNMAAKVSTGATNIFGSSTMISTTNMIVPSGSIDNKKSEQYCAKLKGLNESVSKWIARKVEENPLISLQPIFKDYEKYLGEIEKAESSDLKSDKPASNSNATNLIPTFNFQPSADKNTKAIPDSTSEKVTEKKDDKPTFTFGGPIGSSSGPTLSFGFTSGTSTNTLPSSGTSSTSATFSFGNNISASGSTLFPSSTGFSFGALNKPADSDKPKEDDDNSNDENEDETQKEESKPVVEEGHIYTIRCKVFVKKDGKFGDRGVGNLYLKPIDKSEKKQLIVRADTNLGNVLVNLILSESVPTKRMGNKDVMLVAVPTPDSKPPPVPLLLRVKSAEEADKLLEVLEKHKK